jgi:1-phosphofructokinase family hexose kinase
MILTLTPNPSLDLLFTAERLVWDDANRIPMPRRRPGGQGINLVRAARSLIPDAAVLAIAPLGGPVGGELGGMLAAEGTPLRAVTIDRETRVFVGVRESETGRALLLNPRGPMWGDGDQERLMAAVEEALEDAGSSTGAGAGQRSTGWLACCGSLPPGLPTDFYARAGLLARRHGFRVVADCDGPALAEAAAVCHLLVPNAHEASRLSGEPVTDAASACRAGRKLLRRDVELVAITLGADGAVAISPQGSWRCLPRIPEDLAAGLAGGSAVGAGDAFLAALLLALDRRGPAAESVPAALARAVAAGTATLLSRGADLIRREDVDRVARHVVTEAMPLAPETRRAPPKRGTSQR